MKTVREFVLPPPGSPHWVSSGDPPGGLLYLAWGRRDYGRNPIPRRLHHGWSYLAVMAGRPTFLAGTRRRVLRAGDLVVAGPDAPYGWEDRPGASCELLVWAWSSAPSFGKRVGERTCWIRNGSGETAEELRELHRVTRREIQDSDVRSSRVLQALHVLLDAAFERADGRKMDFAERDLQRLRLAEEWMRRHLEVRAPARALADYLGVSPMGLLRLFRRAAGLSPGEAFQQLKMREAAVLLCRPGVSVKETAYMLGYNHSGDFTRAFAKFYGRAPSDMQEEAARGRKKSGPSKSHRTSENLVPIGIGRCQKFAE